MLRAGHGIDGTANQVLTSRSQDLAQHGLNRQEEGERSDLNPNIIWDFIVFDESTDKLKVGFARGGVCHFNLLNPALYELSEESSLLFNIHGVCQGLISIPEVCG